MTATISASAKRISYQNQSQITDIHTPSSPDASRKEKLTMQSITVHRKLSEEQAGQSLLYSSYPEGHSSLSQLANRSRVPVEPNDWPCAMIGRA